MGNQGQDVGPRLETTLGMERLLANTIEDYRQMLGSELERRQSRNPRYSLRAFARDIGLHASDLSKILRGKKPIPLSTAVSVVPRMNWTPDRQQDFLVAVYSEALKQAISAAGTSS